MSKSAERAGAPPSPVRVLVNAVHAHAGGGVTYLRNMLPRLADDAGLELHLVIHASQRALIDPGDARIRVHAFHFPNGFLARLAWEQLALPMHARRLSADVTFSPANFGPLLAPRPVILLRNALSVAASEGRMPKRLYWRALGIMTTLSVLGCRRAIAVSEFARRDLSGGLPERFARRVSVIHHGVAPVFSPAPEMRREGFLLAVGDLYVQKNLHGLIEAIDRLRGRFPAIRLKIAGEAVDAGYASRLGEAIAARGLGGHVELMGRLSPEALVDLYRRCALFVFPSLVETFGMPLVEAMACGAPVLSARASAMPEIAGDAALYFDADDPADMAERIAEALDDAGLRRNLTERAAARAQAFSWEETARRTARVLKDAALSDR